MRPSAEEGAYPSRRFVMAGSSTGIRPAWPCWGEPGSPETAYHWGSMTKVVTAVAVMQLEERGIVGLDSPIARYLPEFPARFGITIRNLLNHSSGLPESEVTHLVSYRGQPLPTLEVILSDYLARVDRLDFKPGTESQYCNWNYLALGVLIERITGRPFASSVADTVLRPAGMAHTSFRYAELPPGTPLASPVIPVHAESALLAVLNEKHPEWYGEGVIDRRKGRVRAYLTDFDILAPWGRKPQGWQKTSRGSSGRTWTRASPSPRGAYPLRRCRPCSGCSAPRMGNRSTGASGPVQQEKGEEILEHGGGGPGIEALMRLYPKRRLGVVVMGNIDDYGVGRILAAAADIL